MPRRLPRMLVVTAVAAATFSAVGSGATVGATAPDTPYEQLCTSFLGEVEGELQCRFGANATLERFRWKFVDHTMFWATCRAAGYEAFTQILVPEDGDGETDGDPLRDWVLVCA